MNVRRATVEDREFVTRIYTSPDIWDRVSDDFTPGRDVIDLTDALRNPNIYILIPDNIGVFMYHPLNTILYQTHASVLPEFRGKKALEGARATGMWMYQNTLCRKVICLIPHKNYQAMAFARSLGFHKEGVLTKSIMKHGELVDLHCYGIERGDV